MFADASAMRAAALRLLLVAAILGMSERAGTHSAWGSGIFLIGSSEKKIGRSINEGIFLRRPNATSSVLRYCNVSNCLLNLANIDALSNNNEQGQWGYNHGERQSIAEHCWEPSDLQGEWVLLNQSAIATGTNARIGSQVTANPCPGWEFTKTCANGYAYNVECPSFVEKYRWIPRIADEGGLRFPRQFNADGACRLLSNRTVLVLGDSTMGQASSALHNAFLPGGCQQNIIGVLSDTLVKRPLGHMNRGPHWTTAVDRVGPDIVIYSFGAHITGEHLFKEVFNETLAEMSRMEAETNNSIRFVYKTQSPGGCSRTISSERPDRAAASYPPEALKYQHAMFHGRDLYAIGQLKSRGRSFLDMRMLYNRGDAHPGSAAWPKSDRKTDCLHFCSPGPLDVIADLFYDLLLSDLSL